MTIPISGRRILVNLVIQIIPIPFWGCLSGADGYDTGVVDCQRVFSEVFQLLVAVFVCLGHAWRSFFELNTPLGRGSGTGCSQAAPATCGGV